jgi:drug/metabolite transporter (DMT)-like permease
VTRGYVPLLLLVSGLWGASYLFIKVGVEEMEPSTLMAGRFVLAGAVLLGVLVVQRGLRGAIDDLRSTGRHGVILGILNGVVPFWLISWGETRIDSGVAAVANATVPIFVALLALRVNPGERSTGLRLVGILAGLAGVAVLAGIEPEHGTWAILGVLAVVLASLFYAGGNLYTQHNFAGTAPIVIATSSVASGALLVLPAGIVQAPGDVPSWKALGSVVALGVLGTAVASLVLYRLIARYGSSRTALVTYLLPVFALFYGAVLLDEPLRLSALLGLLLILAGVALGSGLARRPRPRMARV